MLKDNYPSDILTNVSLNPEILKKLEERKKVEDADHKLTEELFLQTDDHVRTNIHLEKEKRNIKFINKKKQMDKNQKTEKNNQKMKDSCKIKECKKNAKNIEETFGSCADICYEYVDLEDKFMH